MLNSIIKIQMVKTSQLGRLAAILNQAILFLFPAETGAENQPWQR